MRLVEADRQLTFRVEVDDAYHGGQRSGGNTGCGSENKVPFVALPLTVVSAGLVCFTSTASLGACQNRTVSGGG